MPGTTVDDQGSDQLGTLGSQLNARVLKPFHGSPGGLNHQGIRHM
jgi:hypothetical protein